MTATHLLSWLTGLASLGLIAVFLIATAKNARRGNCGHNGGVSALACLAGAMLLGAATSIIGALQ